MVQKKKYKTTISFKKLKKDYAFRQSNQPRKKNRLESSGMAY